MRLQFNPTGTHIHKGFLKVRVDLYPEPTDKTYVLHHIQVPVIPPEGYRGKVDEFGSPINQDDYNLWIESLPKVWQLNPCLCHFVAVPENFMLPDLQEYLARLFNPDSIATLDNVLVQPNSIHLVSPFMRQQAPFAREKVVTKDLVDLISIANLKLPSISIPLSGDGEVIDIEPQTIDVGSAATNRASAGWDDYVQVSTSNPANATGTIDTVETWTPNALTEFTVGTFYVVSAFTLHCRDSEAIGNVASGSKQTFTPLTISVTEADFLGCWCATGNGPEKDFSGDPWYYKSDSVGTYIQPGAETGFSYSVNVTFSLYGTGTEAGPAVVEGLAAGSGIGLASSASLLEVLASASGESIGLAESSSYLEVLALASGQGVGLATAQAILDVLAEADGSGVGLGTTVALLEVLAAAAVSGEGLGEAEALLEVIAEATGEGIGIGEATGEVVILAVTVLGAGAGSGIGTASVEALLDVLAGAQGHGVGISETTGVFLVLLHVKKPPAVYTLGRIRSISYNLGQSLVRYTLGKKRR